MSAVKFEKPHQDFNTVPYLLNFPAVVTKEKIVPLLVKPVRAKYDRILHLFIYMLNKRKMKVGYTIINTSATLLL